MSDAAVETVVRHIWGDHCELAAHRGEWIVLDRDALKQAGVHVEAARIVECDWVLREQSADVLDSGFRELPRLQLAAMGTCRAMFGMHPLEKRHRAECEQRNDDQRQDQDAAVSIVGVSDAHKNEVSTSAYD